MNSDDRSYSTGTAPAASQTEPTWRRPTGIDLDALIDEVPLSRFQARVIGLCALVSVLEGYDIQALSYAAPVLSASLAIDPAALGSVFGLFVVGCVLGSVLFGALADRFGRRVIVIGGTVVFGLGSVATMFADTVGALLVVRFLTGLGVGAVAPNVVALTSEYTPRRLRSTAGMAMLAGLPAGSVIGGLLAATLMPAWGWQSVFLLGGVVPLIAAVGLVFCLPESPRFLVVRRGGGERVHRIVRRIAPDLRIDGDIAYTVGEETPSGLSVLALLAPGRRRVTLLLWAAIFMNLLVLFFLGSWLPLLFVSAGLPVSTAIFASTLLAAGGVVGALVLGRLMDRSGRPALVLAAAVATAIASVLALPGLLPAVVPTFLVAFLLGIGTVGAQTGVVNLAGSAYPTAIRATGVGWAYGVGRVGSIIGPVLGGLLIAAGWDASSLFVAAVLPASICLIGLVLLGTRRDARA